MVEDCGWDADNEDSIVSYRFRIEIEGYLLRKPFEIIYFDNINAVDGERYKAKHILPSKNPNQMGEFIGGIGPTSEAAADDLVKKITDLYEKICENNPTSPDQFVQRGYLKSIMIKK